jgi:hypothetical protein
MMASVSDNIRILTGVFTTALQIMSDEPAFLNWLPDADALGRPCRILFAIAVISDKVPPQLVAGLEAIAAAPVERHSHVRHWRPDWLAGAGGFEPLHFRIGIHPDSQPRGRTRTCASRTKGAPDGRLDPVEAGWSSADLISRCRGSNASQMKVTDPSRTGKGASRR